MTKNSEILKKYNIPNFNINEYVPLGIYVIIDNDELINVWKNDLTKQCLKKHNLDGWQVKSLHEFLFFRRDEKVFQISQPTDISKAMSNLEEAKKMLLEMDESFLQKSIYSQEALFGRLEEMVKAIKKVHKSVKK